MQTCFIFFSCQWNVRFFVRAGGKIPSTKVNRKSCGEKEKKRSRALIFSSTPFERNSLGCTAGVERGFSLLFLIVWRVEDWKCWIPKFFSFSSSILWLRVLPQLIPHRQDRISYSSWRTILIPNSGDWHHWTRLEPGSVIGEPTFPMPSLQRRFVARVDQAS